MMGRTKHVDRMADRHYEAWKWKRAASLKSQKVLEFALVRGLCKTHPNFTAPTDEEMEHYMEVYEDRERLDMAESMFYRETTKRVERWLQNKEYLFLALLFGIKIDFTKLCEWDSKPFECAEIVRQIEEPAKRFLEGVRGFTVEVCGCGDEDGESAAADAESKSAGAVGCSEISKCERRKEVLQYDFARARALLGGGKAPTIDQLRQAGFY